MLGYRWGEPARSQAVHHASIGLRAACLRVRFAAGPPVRCARRLRPGPTAARDRDRPGGQASATGRCGRSSTGRCRRHQGRCASSLRVRTEDPAARAESAGSRHRARRCPVIPGCAGRRPAGRARNRGAARRIDAQSRGARATIAGKGEISSVETSSRSAGRVASSSPASCARTSAGSAASHNTRLPAEIAVTAPRPRLFSPARRSAPSRCGRRAWPCRPAARRSRCLAAPWSA